MFAINTAEDMLEKAKTELELYRQAPNPHVIFNLFITIFHIQDYISNGARRIKKRKYNRIVKDKIKKHFGEYYLWMKFICDKQKHYHLDNREHQSMQSEATQQHTSSVLGGAPLNTLPLNGNDQYILTYKGQSIELGALAETLISKWEELISPTR